MKTLRNGKGIDFAIFVVRRARAQHDMSRGTFECDVKNDFTHQPIQIPLPGELSLLQQRPIGELAIDRLIIL